MKMKESLIEYAEKQMDFEDFVEVVKWKTQIGKALTSAFYEYEVKQRKDDPTKCWVNEWLCIKADGYQYNVNACANSQLANEKMLLAVKHEKRYSYQFDREVMKCQSKS